MTSWLSFSITLTSSPLFELSTDSILSQEYQKRFASQKKKAAPEQIYTQAQLRRSARQACNLAYLRYFKATPAAIVDLVKDENTWLGQVCAGEAERFLDDFFPEYIPHKTLVPEAYRYIPRRTFIAPLNKLEDLTAGDAEKTKAYKAFVKDFRKQVNSSFSFEALIQYHMDSKKTLWQIAQSATHEANEGTVEYVHAYVQFLNGLGLVEI
jgi:uncharacterized protein YbgA (DUF1722 family)